MPPLTPRTTGEAGAFDFQFNQAIPRQLPPLMAVQLTGPFDPETGYPWVELRLNVELGGFVIPDLPLVGTLGYDINGNTGLQAGQRGLMAIDRDQTGYQLWMTLAAPTSGSGSGSGSGGYCEHATPTLSTSFENLTFQFQIPSLDVTTVDGQVALTTCSTSTTSIGPFNPTSPNGGSLSVVKSVCPVYTEICYLDCDNNPQTIQVVTALKNFRTFLVATAAGPTGCLLSATDACCGSGSGSGNPEKCTTLTANCGAGQSTQLTLTNPLEGIETILYYDSDPSDGNVNRYLTADLQYELVYDLGLATWVLTNLDTGAVWVAPAGFWECTGTNLLAPVDPDSVSFFTTTPVFDCAEVGYICDTGACYGVPLSISDYDTRGECEADCAGLRYSCVGSGCVEDPAGEFTDPLVCALLCNAPVSPPVSPTSSCLAAFLTQQGLTTLPETLHIRFLSGWTTIAGTCSDMVEYAVNFDYGTGNWVSAEQVAGQARASVGCSDDGMGNYYLSVGLLDDNGCGAAEQLTVTPGYTDGGIVLGTADINMTGNVVPPCVCKGSATATVTIS